jgi:hypothetical protein
VPFDDSDRLWGDHTADGLGMGQGVTIVLLGAIDVTKLAIINLMIREHRFRVSAAYGIFLAREYYKIYYLLILKVNKH